MRFQPEIDGGISYRIRTLRDFKAGRNTAQKRPLAHKKRVIF